MIARLFERVLAFDLDVIRRKRQFFVDDAVWLWPWLDDVQDVYLRIRCLFGQLADAVAHAVLTILVDALRCGQRVFTIDRVNAPISTCRCDIARCNRPRFKRVPAFDPINIDVESQPTSNHAISRSFKRFCVKVAAVNLLPNEIGRAI